jgi:hypothetical protein
MSSSDAYTFGFYIGVFLPIIVLLLIFWFVGRWGWIGLVIRIACAALIVLRILSLLATLPSS